MSTLSSVSECLAVNSFRWATGMPLNSNSYSTLEGGQDNEPAKLTKTKRKALLALRNL